MSEEKKFGFRGLFRKDTHETGASAQTGPAEEERILKSAIFVSQTGRYEGAGTAEDPVYSIYRALELFAERASAAGAPSAVGAPASAGEPARVIILQDSGVYEEHLRIPFPCTIQAAPGAAPTISHPTWAEFRQIKRPTGREGKLKCFINFLRDGLPCLYAVYPEEESDALYWSADDGESWLQSALPRPCRLDTPCVCGDSCFFTMEYTGEYAGKHDGEHTGAGRPSGDLCLLWIDTQGILDHANVPPILNPQKKYARRLYTFNGRLVEFRHSSHGDANAVDIIEYKDIVHNKHDPTAHRVNTLEIGDDSVLSPGYDNDCILDLRHHAVADDSCLYLVAKNALLVLEMGGVTLLPVDILRQAADFQIYDIEKYSGEIFALTNEGISTITRSNGAIAIEPLLQHEWCMEPCHLCANGRNEIAVICTDRVYLSQDIMKSWREIPFESTYIQDGHEAWLSRRGDDIYVLYSSGWDFARWERAHIANESGGLVVIQGCALDGQNVVSFVYAGNVELRDCRAQNYEALCAPGAKRS